MDRFWSSINKTETCWLWIGAKTHSGYGTFYGPNGRIRAHRFAWELVNGPIPDGLYVCHRCDIRACVNPDHLFLGTPQDNIDDMWEKGRGLIGETNPHTVVTADQVREIRKRRAAGESYRDLMIAFGVSDATIYRILKGKRWTHVE